MRIWKLMSAVAVATSLVACGGGGGGGTSPAVASTLEFPLRTAYLNKIANSSSTSYSISGTLNGVTVTGSGTTVSGSLSAGTFEGINALTRTSTVSMTLSDGRTSVPIDVSGNIYYDNNYNYLGTSVTGSYEVATSATNLPITIKLNDTGTIYTATEYTSSSKSTIDSRNTVTYTTFADTATSIILKLIETSLSTSGVTKSITTDTYRLSSDGTLTPKYSTTVIIADETNLTRTY